MSECSTDGGEEGITSRATTPFASSSRSRTVSILSGYANLADFQKGLATRLAVRRAMHAEKQTA